MAGLEIAAFIEPWRYDPASYLTDADLLRRVARLPQGAVVLPDLDLSMDAEVWEELGTAGERGAETPFGRGDAVTHPQYHLKLLLNRMGVNRAEVQPWHRRGLAALDD